MGLSKTKCTMELAALDVLCASKVGDDISNQ